MGLKETSTYGRGSVEIRQRERAGGRGERERECVCVGGEVQNEAREGGTRAHSLVATLRSFVSDLGLPRWH